MMLVRWPATARATACLHPESPAQLRTSAYRDISLFAIYFLQCREPVAYGAQRNFGTCFQSSKALILRLNRIHGGTVFPLQPEENGVGQDVSLSRSDAEALRNGTLVDILHVACAVVFLPHLVVLQHSSGVAGLLLKEGHDAEAHGAIHDSP